MRLALLIAVSIALAACAAPIRVVHEDYVNNQVTLCGNAYSTKADLNERAATACGKGVVGLLSCGEYNETYTPWGGKHPQPQTVRELCCEYQCQK